MDFIALKKRISEGITKYKYACVVLLVGIILMLLPNKTEEKIDANVQKREEEPVQMSTEEQLEEVLSQLEGAGKVQVMLSVEQGERTIYQTDTTYSQGQNDTDTRTQTILITDSNRNETGLVHQKNPPVYLGAIIMLQGADDPGVKLAVVEAVSDVTGLGADKISVLKMR